MQEFVHVGHRMLFPRDEGWVTAHNVRRLLTRCLLLGITLAACCGLAFETGYAATTGFVLGLAWIGPSAVELWAERRAHQSLRWSIAAALVGVCVTTLALLQLDSTRGGGPGSPWIALPDFDPQRILVILQATLLMTFATYYRLRALSGNPLPDLLALSVGLSALGGVPLLLLSVADGSAIAALSTLLITVSMALAAAIASLPLVLIAYWSDWLCARYLTTRAL